MNSGTVRFLILFLALAVFSCRGASPEWVNGVVAVVNDTPITLDDIKVRTAALEEQLFRQYGRDPAMLRQQVDSLRQQYLERMIDRHLIIHEFQSEGYSLPESIIEDQVQERIRREYGDRLTLTKTLKARGLTYESFRDRIHKEVIVEALTASKVNSVVLVSPHEIEKYYRENGDKYQQGERVHLWMIFIAHRPAEPDYARGLLEEIRRKIQEGASFADMASVYDDGQRKVDGGDWGWVEKSVLREDLDQVAFSLDPGAISEVLQREEGCYLLQVEDRQPASPRPLAEVRADIENILIAEERNRLQKQWISTLRKQGFVRYF